MCISCTEPFHKKCFKLTPETFNKFHVTKNFLCVDCSFKNLPFYQSSDSYSTDLKSNFPNNDQLKFLNNCNSLDMIRNNEEGIFKVNSEYFTIKEFLNLDLNDMSLNIFDINIASLNKYTDDLHNLCSIIKLQIQVIGICEHKIKKSSCLNGLQPGCTFEFEQTTSTHGGVSFFINDNFCYKVRNDLKMLLYGCLESIFIEISFDKKTKIIFGLIHRHPRMPINDFCDDYLIEYLNKIAILDNTCILMGEFKINLLKSHANNVTSKFLEIMTFCFFCSLYSVGLSATLIGNILINSLEFVTTSGNLLC